MSLDPKSAMEALGKVASGDLWIDKGSLERHLRAVLAEVERLEQERNTLVGRVCDRDETIALLRAECVKNRALRRAYPTDAGFLDVQDAYHAARAAVDAAGLLKGGE